MRHGLSKGQCETEGLSMVIAGSDTTASVMRITMLHIMSVPRVYQKFKAEIANAVRKGVSSPITVEEAKKIPYLQVSSPLTDVFFIALAIVILMFIFVSLSQAIIYEGLRMRPPAPGLSSKSVPAEGDVIHGKAIPGGTAIGMNTSSLLRSKTVFGQDADLFRPERFIEADEATRIRMGRDVELAFGYGRWMCAGKSVALMELNKVFFEVSAAQSILDPTVYGCLTRGTVAPTSIRLPTGESTQAMGLTEFQCVRRGEYVGEGFACPCS